MSLVATCEMKHTHIMVVHALVDGGIVGVKTVFMVIGKRVGLVVVVFVDCEPGWVNQGGRIRVGDGGRVVA